MGQSWSIWSRFSIWKTVRYGMRLVWSKWSRCAKQNRDKESVGQSWSTLSRFPICQNVWYGIRLLWSKWSTFAKWKSDKESMRHNGQHCQVFLSEKVCDMVWDSYGLNGQDLQSKNYDVCFYFQIGSCVLWCGNGMLAIKTFETKIRQIHAT